MSENKLLSCPFCGGEAEIVVGKFEYERSPEVMFDYTPRCKECSSEGDLFYTKEEAIKAWNTRKPMEKIVERLKDSAIRARDSKDLSKFSAYFQAIEIVEEEGEIEG